MGDMRQHIRERTDLAVIYARDGAYRRAAQILAILAQEVSAHADRVDRHLNSLAGGSDDQ